MCTNSARFCARLRIWPTTTTTSAIRDCARPSSSISGVGQSLNCLVGLLIHPLLCYFCYFPFPGPIYLSYRASTPFPRQTEPKENGIYSVERGKRRRSRKGRGCAFLPLVGDCENLFFFSLISEVELLRLTFSSPSEKSFRHHLHLLSIIEFSNSQSISTQSLIPRANRQNKKKRHEQVRDEHIDIADRHAAEIRAFEVLNSHNYSSQSSQFVRPHFVLFHRFSSILSTSQSRS